MTNAVCKSYNKSWVVVHYCRLKAYSRAKTSLNINVTFVEPARNISVHFKTMKKANGYKPFLFDYTFDACEFMRRRNQPVAKIIWYMIRNVSTINHTCPYEVRSPQTAIQGHNPFHLSGLADAERLSQSRHSCATAIWGLSTNGRLVVRWQNAVRHECIFHIYRGLTADELEAQKGQ